jgi:hypothetical protein
VRGLINKGLFITASLAALQKETGTGLLSLINGRADGWKAGEDKPVLVIKAKTGSSLRDMLSKNDWESEDKAESLLRDRLVYWDQFIGQDPAAWRNPVFKRLADAFDDKCFTGALVFGLSVTDFSKKDICGSPLILKQARFQAPFFQVNIPKENSAWNMAKASVWGFLSLAEPVAFPMENGGQTGFSLERTDVLLEQGKIACSGAVCRLLLPDIFSSAAGGDRFLSLYGAYELTAGSGQAANRYDFILLNHASVTPVYSALERVTLETLESSVSFKDANINISLTLGGRLLFKTAGETFDPFSYGNEKPGSLSGGFNAEPAPKPDGLPFGGLRISYEITGGKVKESNVNYKGVTVHSEKAESRKNSFAKAFASGGAAFLCWENSSAPEALGYMQITAPCKQGKLEKYWYGLCFPVAITKDIILKCLFAWSVNGRDVAFYSGAMAEAFGSPKKLKITVGSLFHLGFQSVMLQSEPLLGSVRYILLLKGLSVGLLGLSMPQNSCDITFISGADKQGQPCKAWISVYGTDKSIEEKEGAGSYANQIL